MLETVPERVTPKRFFLPNKAKILNRAKSWEKCIHFSHTASHLETHIQYKNVAKK